MSHSLLEHAFAIVESRNRRLTAVRQSIAGKQPALRVSLINDRPDEGRALQPRPFWLQALSGGPWWKLSGRRGYLSFGVVLQLSTES